MIQQAGEDQLRIEERRASLKLERQLCDVHAELQFHFHALEASGQQKAADALLASCWHLGVAVEQVVKLRNGL